MKILFNIQTMLDDTNDNLQLDEILYEQNFETQKNTVSALDDTKRLMDIALDGFDEDIGLEVVKRLAYLRAEMELEQIGLSSVDPYLREAAIKSVTSQQSLLRIIENERDRYVRLVAVEALTKQDALAEQDALTIIASNDEDPTIKILAADNLSNRLLADNIYVEIVNSSCGSRVKIAAAERLIDKNYAEQVLTHIAQSDDYYWIGKYQ